MTWWYWLLLGLVLILAEILTPGGFYLLFFGAGALVVGLLAGAQALTALWLQWTLFALVSIALVVLLRRPLVEMLRPPAVKDVDTLIGETALAMREIGVNDIGKAELRGASWNARNVGPAPIAAGQRCRVEKVDGLMLYISAE
jgi:membrane protein implicated in regulation of membrane protease activity